MGSLTGEEQVDFDRSEDIDEEEEGEEKGVEIDDVA